MLHAISLSAALGLILAVGGCAGHVALPASAAMNSVDSTAGVAVGAEDPATGGLAVSTTGVSEEAVSPTPRSGLDATGTGGHGCSRGRRVDILLLSKFALPPDEERRWLPEVSDGEST